MKKAWQMISKSYLGFGIVLFGIVIAFSMFQSANQVTVTFGEEQVTVYSASHYSFILHYDEVNSAELTEIPDLGTSTGGSSNNSISTGTWNNDTWGDYTICADMDVTQCIVIRTDDGTVYVFNCMSNERTEEIYELLQSHIA